MFQIVIDGDQLFLLPSHPQDTFLPHVERGTLTLIGATTENPSFQVNAALLSRCRVIVLEKLSVEAIEAILMRAVRSLGVQILGQGDQHSSSATGSSSESSEWVLYGLQGVNAHSLRNWLPARERMKQLGVGRETLATSDSKEKKWQHMAGAGGDRRERIQSTGSLHPKHNLTVWIRRQLYTWICSPWLTLLGYLSLFCCWGFAEEASNYLFFMF